MTAVPPPGHEGDATSGPGHLVVVTGTTTEVGKTWLCVQVLGALRSGGTAVAARKPVQSYSPGCGPTDADQLAAASGERPSQVCPPHRWYEVAMAPPIAARVLGRPGFSLADLLSELRWPEGVSVGVVETVGGPRSPVAADADSAALVRAVGPDTTVLVADAGLGAINAVVLAAAALPRPPVVFLNRYSDGEAVHALNAEWLRGRCGLDVCVEPAEVVRRLG
ncbi:MAG TPA: dethiobiotin synthase [Acidimicrobiales bacterium]|nr:dethiobiotin synthase [Acidimicrobiales bacterium]